MAQSGEPQTKEIFAAGQTFAVALSSALNQVVELGGRENSRVKSSLAVPLRAREMTLAAVAEAMLNELLAEIGEGLQINSVQLDGLMKRDGDYICWGYAFAAPVQRSPVPTTLTIRELTVVEEPGQFEIRFKVEQLNESADCE